ncbi:MAG: LysR substrate-binding domain-containing protein [Pseudomonadota bacterium]|jgi:DNA-binding transcriptional LysR family regulator
MDTMWLEDFITLADEMNFSRAAEARNMTQPAFSRRIRALEDWIGATLVDRDTHRIALTEAGFAFRGIAEEILRRLSLGRDQVREIGGAQVSELRFASTHALSVTFFPSWFRGLEDGWDVGTVTLVADHMTACERFMLEGKADLLLCHHHPAASHRLDPSGFSSLHLGDDVLLPVSAAASDGTPIHRLPGTDANPLPYLEFEERSGMGRIIQAAKVAGSGITALQPVFRSHMASVLLTMARDGRGISWTPLSLAETDLKEGRLALAGDDQWHIPIEIRIFRPRARRSQRVEAFWDMLKARSA